RILLMLLPEAQRHTLEVLETGIHDVKDLHARRALPTVIGYSVLAGTAGGISVPFGSFFFFARQQRDMIRQVAELYGRPLSAERFAEVAEKLRIGSLRRQTKAEMLKLVPTVGIVASATAAGATTYAVGRAYCHYDALLAHGELPEPAEL